MGIAFFLSASGNLIRVPDSHIGFIIGDPKRFGLTPTEIRSVYDKYKEPVGVEGEARREILLKIISNGWIRIRRYRNYWSVTMASLSPTAQARLQDWAEEMFTGKYGFKESDRYTPVKISTTEGHFLFTMQDMTMSRRDKTGQI
jgi:hypothetical protein